MQKFTWHESRRLRDYSSAAQEHTENAITKAQQFLHCLGQQSKMSLKEYLQEKRVEKWKTFTTFIHFNLALV